MSMEWVASNMGGSGKISDADLIISANSKGQITFSFKPSIVRLKYYNMDRIFIGFDEEKMEIGFKPTNEKRGSYKLSQGTSSLRYSTKITSSKFPRWMKVSDVVNTYPTLSYDTNGEYYYVKVGDETFKAAKVRAGI